MASESPIENRIGAVFVHVTDMQRAVDWYSTLLGVPSHGTSREGLIYDVPMAGPPASPSTATRMPADRSGPAARS
jgi:hypothetical protein